MVMGHSVCSDWKSLLGLIDDKDEKILEEIRRCIVLQYYGDELEEARMWIARFLDVMEKARSVVGAKSVLLSKELRSFVQNPLHHLMKKLFIYTHDLAKGKYSVEEYERIALSAIRTSLRTNLRSIYENWVLLGLVVALSRYPLRLFYPEHGALLLERNGRQRSGEIPPNFAVHVISRGILSFFLEAPRPIGWGDTRDLSRAWRLYVALRPDIMVYSGFLESIIDLGNDPPIKRPEVIIEVKELSDWFTRVREVRGPFARALTAEEWRNRWIRGLWAGLADVLGVDTPEKAYEHVRKRKGLRLSEPQIVKLYLRVYKPRKLFLVSKEPVDRRIRSELEAEGVEVVDGVGFDATKLNSVAEYLAKVASYNGVSGVPVVVPAETLSYIEKLAVELGVELEKVVEAALRAAAENPRVIEETLRIYNMGEHNT
jgi:hypothetical protein